MSNITDSKKVMEQLMVLGVGNGDLIVPFSRELDQTFKGKAPYVIKASSLKINHYIQMLTYKSPKILYIKSKIK